MHPSTEGFNITFPHHTILCLTPISHSPAYHAAQRLGISSHLLSRLTGTVFLAPPMGDGLLDETEMRNKLNIGLNLKNNKKNEEVRAFIYRSLAELYRIGMSG
ncbi:5'-3' exoribonuclease 1 [Portunus trituberculatus]|uniref:5'-3' exoribonuclease 1 n=1 Tax=Portunus trituberculatus TaxID=210409 RepID=A0A5B7EDI2_PORTR|nr:5'-3' exoribonuclease 1 [Portunus trituberculatus]